MEVKKITYRTLLTEFLGSTIIVIITCISFKAKELNKIDSLGLGVVNGLIVAALVWTCYFTSGAHFNPALSLSFFVIRKKSLFIVS